MPISQTFLYLQEIFFLKFDHSLLTMPKIMEISSSFLQKNPIEKHNQRAYK